MAGKPGYDFRCRYLVHHTGQQKQYNATLGQHAPPIRVAFLPAHCIKNAEGIHHGVQRYCTPFLLAAIAYGLTPPRRSILTTLPN